MFETRLNKVGKTETFEFSINKGSHLIGLAINDKDYHSSFGNVLDGNYTIEYFLNGKLDRIEHINKKSLPKYYKGLYKVSGSTKMSSWKQETLGKLKVPGNYKIKITVVKPESSLVDYKGEMYFYAHPFDEKISKMFTDGAEERKRKRLLKNLMDSNETNPSLIPLRVALDKGDITAVKSIFNSDNNITVNTLMVFDRTPLQYTSFYNHSELARYLIDNGADIHHKDRMDKNALAYAIENNALQTAKLLIENGTNVNDVFYVQGYLTHKIAKDLQGSEMSALQYTTGNGFFEMTELLLKNGMKDTIMPESQNINIHTYIYSTWWTTMSKKEKEEMQALFDQYGVEVKNLNKVNKI